MKKIIIPFVVLMAAMSMNAQTAIKVSKNGEEVKVFQNTSSSTYRVDFERADEGNKTGVSGGHSWTQLWRGGPKFADFNLGARITDYSQAQGSGLEWGKAPYTIENCGFHFAWGGFKDDFDDHLSSTTENLTGSNDEATMLWNNSWRLPTMEEFRCLLDGIEFTIDNRQSVIKGTYCTWEWMDGVEKQYRTGCTLRGWKICGMYDYTECSIFLPAAGYYYSYEDDRYAYIGDYAYYWTSSAHTNVFAWMFQTGWNSSINMGDARTDTNSRYYNFSIRPVVAE